jgi:hypothetical protein
LQTDLPCRYHRGITKAFRRAGVRSVACGGVFPSPPPNACRSARGACQHANMPTCQHANCDLTGRRGLGSEGRRARRTWPVPRTNGDGLRQANGPAMCVVVASTKPGIRTSTLVLLHCFGRSSPVRLMLRRRDVPRRPLSVALAEARDERATEAVGPGSGAGHA